MDLAKIRDEDLTAPDARTRFIVPVAEDEITLLGAPVYCGRLPQEGALRLRRLEGQDTPAVVVVVCGNREYGDALLELRDLAIEQGFRPIVGAAFIGEHSFCSAEHPIAVGRPDAVDLTWARELGREMAAQLASLSASAAIPLLEVPGNFPYEDVGEPFGRITPVTLLDACDACAQACPTAAISVNDVAPTKAALCIMCCACVRVCPPPGPSRRRRSCRRQSGSASTARNPSSQCGSLSKTRHRVSSVVLRRAVSFHPGFHPGN